MDESLHLHCKTLIALKMACQVYTADFFYPLHPPPPASKSATALKNVLIFFFFNSYPNPLPRNERERGRKWRGESEASRTAVPPSLVPASAAYGSVGVCLDMVMAALELPQTYLHKKMAASCRPFLPAPSGRLPSMIGERM